MEFVVCEKNTFVNVSTMQQAPVFRSMSARELGHKLEAVTPVYCIQDNKLTKADRFSMNSMKKRHLRNSSIASESTCMGSVSDKSEGIADLSDIPEQEESMQVGDYQFQNLTPLQPRKERTEKKKRHSRENPVVLVQDVARANAVPEDQWTTVMVRNIPCRYSQNELLSEVAMLDLQFNFLYLPPARRSPGNLGYAFVNFVDHEQASMFIRLFDGHTFLYQPKSQKRAEPVFAKLQGFQQNLDFYSNMKVFKSKYRPFVDAGAGKA